MSLRTFKKGGVHPPEQKLSADRPIEQLALPPKVIIPLSQHIGAPATIMVAKGDHVRVGQLIAQSGGFVSANIHASASGTVESVEPVADGTGYRRPAITIAVAGDEWMEGIDRSPTLAHDPGLAPNDILARIAEAGIVGLGGATFPTHVKLTIPTGKQANILIINAVECEPYLTSDPRVMLERGPEIMEGIALLMRAIGVSRAVVGIENNKPDAIAHLEQLAHERSGVEVQPLRVKYPQGGEKMLIKAIMGREVPSGGLPIDVGAVVVNVGTALAVYEAVLKRKPMVERVVTVTGKSLQRPSNFMVRIGTPVSALIEAAGGLPNDTGKIISGGPMMGKALLSTDVAVTKGTSGIVVLPQPEALKQKPQTCIRCARCVSACPLGLEPYLFARLSQHGRFADMEVERVMDCMECGSCFYTCPARVSLLDYIKLGKNEVGALIRARNAKK
ncbi:MAG: electron transport complex subunit RsxC [Bacteroidales bacterium]|nr:electron transport complex subunit RsxC [Bacteroidales bacterium]